MQELCDLLAGQGVYKEYAQALKVANNASPIEMPKADGILEHAQKKLKKAIEAQGADAQTTAEVMVVLKAMALA